MDERGQLSVDFILAFFIMLFVIGGIVTVISQTSDVSSTTELSKARLISDSITRAINTVYTEGDGSYLNVTLPGNFNFNLTVSGGLVTVSSNGKSSNSILIPKSGVDTVNMYPNETYYINNVNGTIKFTKIA